ncbi:hypothetical protein GJ633_15305 [Halorubrum sp. CBA1125]|uniref:hypothetical protein n=1 Tax=Halorubrum sp. CBA1125 TaxID=2668072 RepID=UPI0012E97AFC|nr:hypothetical protein [Halorubrum sp. CBA1125]MUW15825.1 hypothetical protein [Halorubrum sp. CBA1125]
MSDLDSPDESVEDVGERVEDADGSASASANGASDGSASASTNGASDGDAFAGDEAPDRELVKRAIVALADEQGVDVPDAEEVAAIRSRLDELDAAVDEKVADLRERFVDLYQQLEETAPSDHTHPALAERLDALEADVAAVEARAEALDALESDVAALESRLEAVEPTVDALDPEAIEDKLSRVASAVVRLRRRVEELEDDRADRERLDALRTTANRNGVGKARCGDCGETVRISLLSRPACPHCDRRFAELDPSPGFFGTSRLVVADPPALDGAVASDETDASGETDAASGADSRSDSRSVSTRDAGGGETRR